MAKPKTVKALIEALENAQAKARAAERDISTLMSYLVAHDVYDVANNLGGAAIRHGMRGSQANQMAGDYAGWIKKTYADLGAAESALSSAYANLGAAVHVAGAIEHRVPVTAGGEGMLLT